MRSAVSDNDIIDAEVVDKDTSSSLSSSSSNSTTTATAKNEGDDNRNDEDKHNTTTASSTTSSSSLSTQQSTNAQQPLSLKQQAEALRSEALMLEKKVMEEKIQRSKKENAKIDSWINELFIQYQVDENTQMLNDVDQVFKLLQDNRYSQEQVDKIFKRICETGPQQSRSSCSPIMTLLVDAAGKLDCIDRKDNPNKRWSGKVERKLRKKLFAKDWGIELEDDDDSANPWNLFR